MKIRYPQMGIALAVAALLAGTCAVSAYAVPETETAGTSTAVTDTTTAANESDDTLWKAEISDYDSSLSLVQYEEVTPSEEQAAAIQNATTLKEVTVPIGSSGTEGSANIGAAASMAASVSAGQFAFTTYGYGHCVGMSQNGANNYATYGGYDYQSILFHYFPGTTLVQEGAGSTVTANGVTGSYVDIISQIVYNEMSSTMHPEAMKAQAIAAYTYIMFNGGSVNNVILKPNPPQNVIDAVSAGALTLEKLEAMTCVCSVGLDMIAIPGDTSPATISGIIADEMALGMINQKTTAVRLIPVIGKTVGDQAEFGGLLGYAPIMPVNRFACDKFVNRGGRIPAPIHSFKN